MSELVFHRLREIVSRFFGTDAELLTPETTAFDVDGWDSIAHTMLILEIEEDLGVGLDLSETGAINNLGELAALIDTKLQSPAVQAR